KRDLVIAEAEIVEEQAEGEVGERVADLVEQDEEENQKRALALEELDEGPPDRRDGPRDALLLGRSTVSLRLPDDQRGDHRRKSERGAGQIGSVPVVSRRDHE